MTQVWYNLYRCARQLTPESFICTRLLGNSVTNYLRQGWYLHVTVHIQKHLPLGFIPYTHLHINMLSYIGCEIFFSTVRVLLGNSCMHMASSPRFEKDPVQSTSKTHHITCLVYIWHCIVSLQSYIFKLLNISWTVILSGTKRILQTLVLEF